MTSNENLINMKVVGNFKMYDLESKSSKKESGCSRKVPITEGYKSNFGILKVGDMVDSNSCHMKMT
jgi:hypothetical protein